MHDLSDPDIFGRAMHPDFRALLRPLLERPLSPQRWGALERPILEELDRRAAALSMTPAEVLYLATVAAMRLANIEGRSLPPRHSADWRLWYRRRIQALVTADLLGTQQAGRTEASPVFSETAAPDAQGAAELHAEAVQVLDELQRAATDAEAEVLDLMAEMIEQGWAPRQARLEAARVTGRTPAAMRQLLRRLRRRHASIFPAE